MIECDNLVKIYKSKDLEVVALQGLDLTVEQGELMAIIGNSGSGKSTLLNMLGGLDKPSAGKLLVDGKELLKFNEKELCEYKRSTVGFVWQNNARNLIPYLTALENVELPMIITNEADRRHRAMELLEMAGIAHRAKNKLSQMSGGEQQRVAIAIALANTPKLLLADEPTGAVDSRTAMAILDLFHEINRSLGITIVIVTHDMAISRKVDRVVSIRDGRTSSEFIRRDYREELANVSGSMAAEEEDARLGSGKETHEEFVVLDRVGRMQIPHEYMEKYDLKANSRLRFNYVDDQIVLEPAELENLRSILHAPAPEKSGQRD
ncbi:MAG: ABC transporter ATP-binding protein [Ruminococcaceae bacterium]|nr:ABC transporter ATP-binding protein [Oscillospiraceae bacterium]